MHLVAFGLLVAAAGLLLLSYVAPLPPVAAGYLRAFAEAALVGGMADWFAVVALFRHPLGLPIPHTAIVPNNKDRNDYQTFIEGLKEPEKSTYERAMRDNPYIYFLDFENVGGLVSPLPLRFTFEDGATKDVLIPAEIWRLNSQKVTKLFVETKKVVLVELDAKHQTADAVRSNNAFPQKNVPSRLDAFRSGSGSTARNQMAEALVELRAKQAQPASPAAPITPAN